MINPISIPFLDQYGRCHFPASVAAQWLQSAAERNPSTEQQAELDSGSCRGGSGNDELRARAHGRANVDADEHETAGNGRGQ